MYDILIKNGMVYAPSFSRLNRFLGLTDRGYLREGARADIVVFDPATVKNNATYENPCQHPDGIPYVIVNGVVTIDNGKHTRALAGEVLRSTRDR